MLNYDDALLALDLIEYRDWHFAITPEEYWTDERHPDAECFMWLEVPHGDGFIVHKAGIEIPADADESWLVHHAFLEIVKEEERQVRERFTWKKRRVFSEEVHVERLWDAAGR
jgi:hypothetical protein